MSGQNVSGYRQANFFKKQDGEDPAFLSEQLITYIGNKRALLDFIGNGLDIVKKRLAKETLATCDLFSGSGIVSRYLKRHSRMLYVNDLEQYAEIINRCYMANPEDINITQLKKYYNHIIGQLNSKPLCTGFITELYAPGNDEEIRRGERVFYTRHNAMYIDTARQLIGTVPTAFRHFLIAPLLSEASVHANTAGVFKGFYKCRNSGIGQFGGTNRDALSRIKGRIHLPFPVFSRYACDVRISRADAGQVAGHLPQIDLAYLDPPYNQHPYGSNYFMLNLVANYRRPDSISQVSGIPDTWNRSAYNKRSLAYQSFRELLEKINAKFLLISFNSEGFIPLKTMLRLLAGIGKVTILETKYNTFRGSRNLRNRTIYIKEYLYLVEKH